MNAAKCTESDYIQFLIATPFAYNGMEAARVSPTFESPPAHGAFTRLLRRLEPEPEALWREVALHVDRSGNRPVSEVALPPTGQTVHLKGYGLIRVFRIVTPDGDTEYWAVNDLSMTDLTRQSLAERGWMIEVYHRSLKQTCGVERCRARSGRAQRNHIGFVLRAFVRLERFFFRTGISEWEAKARIIREAVRAYLASLVYTLASTA